MIHTKLSSALSPPKINCLPLFQLEFDEYASEQSIDYGGLNLIVSSAFYETNSYTPQKTQKNKLHLQETERGFIHDMTHLQFCPRIYLVNVKQS